MCRLDRLSHLKRLDSAFLHQTQHALLAACRQDRKKTTGQTVNEKYHEPNTTCRQDRDKIIGQTVNKIPGAQQNQPPRQIENKLTVTDKILQAQHNLLPRQIENQRTVTDKILQAQHNLPST
jgi:hypothetical protein